MGKESNGKENQIIIKGMYGMGKTIKKRLKDYLNSEECNDMAIAGKLLDMLDHITKTWGERNNLSTEESKGFKMALTWGNKAWDKVMERMSDKGVDTYIKRQKSYYVYVYDRAAFEQVNKKIADATKESYRKEPHYYDLCGLVMEKHCMNCKLKQSKCEFAKEFIKNNVQEPIGEAKYDWKHCKYAYTLDGIKGLEEKLDRKKVV